MALQYMPYKSFDDLDEAEQGVGITLVLMVPILLFSMKKVKTNYAKFLLFLLAYLFAVLGGLILSFGFSILTDYSIIIEGYGGSPQLVGLMLLTIVPVMLFTIIFFTPNKFSVIKLLLFVVTLIPIVLGSMIMTHGFESIVVNDDGANKEYTVDTALTIPAAPVKAPNKISFRTTDGYTYSCMNKCPGMSMDNSFIQLSLGLGGVHTDDISKAQQCIDLNYELCP